MFVHKTKEKKERKERKEDKKEERKERREGRGGGTVCKIDGMRHREGHPHMGGKGGGREVSDVKSKPYKGEGKVKVERKIEGNGYQGKGGGMVGKAKHWIQKAIKHPGALHEELDVPEGKKIPAKKLEKAEKSKNPTEARRARLAETLKGMRKGKKS